MITIVSTGLWLLNQASDKCISNTTTSSGYGEFTSFIYVGAGLCLIFSVLYLFTVLPVRQNWRHNGDQRMILAISCCGVQLLLLILFASLYALTQSSVGFGALKRWISRPERWMNIKHCLYEDTRVCADFQNKFGDDTQHQFLSRDFTPIQSGCCKPPLECSFSYSSPTIWMKPENGTYSNHDCYEWDNNPKKLCYNCDVCKLGYAHELKNAWTISSFVVIVACLIFVLGFILPRVFIRNQDEVEQLIENYGLA
ncbi:unnamed protein product [Amaranthus hypochondriacus]